MSGQFAHKFHPSFTDLGLSSIVAISEEVRRLEGEGRSITKFQRGDLNFVTPQYVRDALVSSLGRGRTNYPKSGGEPNFIASVQTYHAESGVTLNKSNIVCMHGGQEGLQLAFGLFRGKKVLGFSPYWPCLTGNIFPYGENEFHTIDLEETETGISFDADRLESELRKVDLFYFNSPHNPTGKVFTREETKLIDQLCRKHGVVIVSDEPYDQILFDNVRHTSMLEFDNEQTIAVFTMSKSYAATGLRAGYVVCRDPFICDLFSRADYSQTAGVATPIQDAYAVALTDKPNRDAWFTSLRTELQQRRDILFHELSTVFPNLVKPQGAFYFFPNVSSLVPAHTKDSDDFLLQLFMENDVAVIPGGTFGREGHVRISFSATTLDQTRVGAERLAKVLRHSARQQA
ncbi:MAG: pyridoxal phosphate-dependent aminotransferase [bacterium]|nr:pyridoxal phosphate-dependent aminotransferase [bacterium]